MGVDIGQCEKLDEMLTERKSDKIDAASPFGSTIKKLRKDHLNFNFFKVRIAFHLQLTVKAMHVP